MASLNQVNLIGNLGRDPEVKYLASGDAVCNFSIACSESWKDKSTGERKEKTEWVSIVIFGKLAEVAGQYLKKGSQVYLCGKLQTRKWQDKDGNDRYTTEVVCSEMKMLGGRPEGAGQGGGQGAGQQQRQSAPPAPAARQQPPQQQGIPDDDVPFN